MQTEVIGKYSNYESKVKQGWYKIEGVCMVWLLLLQVTFLQVYAEWRFIQTFFLFMTDSNLK